MCRHRCLQSLSHNCEPIAFDSNDLNAHADSHSCFLFAEHFKRFGLTSHCRPVSALLSRHFVDCEQDHQTNEMAVPVWMSLSKTLSR
jgi:hypothetical protein